MNFNDFENWSYLTITAFDSNFVLDQLIFQRNAKSSFRLTMKIKLKLEIGRVKEKKKLSWKERTKQINLHHNVKYDIP